MIISKRAVDAAYHLAFRHMIFMECEAIGVKLAPDTKRDAAKVQKCMAILKKTFRPNSKIPALIASLANDLKDQYNSKKKNGITQG